MPTESQRRDTALRMRVRELIKSGLLPLMVPQQIQGGHGSGQACAACDRPITSAQVEYEVEDPEGDRRMHFHLGCHAAWQMECAQAPTDLPV